MAATLYPFDEPKKKAERPAGVTVRFDAETLKRIRLMADLFNRFDAMRGVVGRKWLETRIIRQAVNAELDAFGKLIGGWPETDKERAALLTDAESVAKRMSQAAKQK